LASIASPIASWQGQRGAEPDEQSVGDQGVRAQRDRREEPDEAVDQDDEQTRQGDADDGGLDGRVDGDLAERRPDGPLLDGLDGHGKRAALDQDRQVVGRGLGEVTRDLGGRAASGLAQRRDDAGGGDDLAVEDDRHALPGGGVGARGGDELAPSAAALAVELDVDDPLAEPLLDLTGRGVADAVAVQELGADDDGVAVLVLEELLTLGGGGALGGDGRDLVERQLRGLSDHLRGLARILDAGKLDDDAVLAGAGEGRLGDAEGVDAPTDDAEGAVGGLGVGLDAFGVTGLEDDLGAALQVETEVGRAGEG
jgi:hypothetical protein